MRNEFSFDLDVYGKLIYKRQYLNSVRYICSCNLDEQKECIKLLDKEDIESILLELKFSYANHPIDNNINSLTKLLKERLIILIGKHIIAPSYRVDR